jgi:hypothetical protein
MMRNSFFNLDNDRLRSGLCALVLGLCANVTLGQSGFFTGSGSVEAVSGVDANVWRVPYVGYGQFAAPQEDVFAQMRGQWNKEIVQGSNQWFIRASGDAKQQVMHRAANAHRVATEVRLLRHLSGNVRGELGLAISQQKQLEVHWADQEQWESMGSMDIQSFARMHFDVSSRMQSTLGVDWNRAVYQRSSPDYGHQLFQLHGHWSWSMLRRARGVRRFDLVNPKRTKNAGTLECGVQFSQRNFNDWRVGEWIGMGFASPLASKGQLEQSGSMPHRVWVDWEVTSRYASPSNQGWSVFVDAIWNRRFDESLGDFGRSSWSAGAGLSCHSPFLKMEMGLYSAIQQYDRRLAWTERGLESLEYRIKSWSLEAEIPTVRGWSYVIRGAGSVRQSNREGASLVHRNTMGFQQVSFGIRWHLGYRRFLAS